MQITPLIEMRNATVFRGRRIVLDRFSLAIDQGEHVAILGPNGAGKTTLIKVLHRELYPRADKNTVFRILGRETWNVWDLRRQIGFVSAELQHRYHERVCVRDVVLSGFLGSIGVQGLARHAILPRHREQADRVLADLALTELAQRPFGALSTGQQRLALLGRALVHEPSTLILDEPVAGLDFGAAYGVMRKLRELAAGGISLVIVTHHLDEIPPEIERIVLLKDGRILADGPPCDVLTDTQLSDAYGVPIEVHKVGSRYFAAPAF